MWCINLLWAYQPVMPAMWLYWQESETGISLMLPNGGRAHVSKHFATAVTLLLALGYQQNSVKVHPFLMSPTTVRELMVCDRGEHFTHRPEGYEVSHFDWRDMTSTSETPVQTWSRTVMQETTSGLDVRWQLNYHAATEMVCELLISCSPMQVTQSELWK